MVLRQLHIHRVRSTTPKDKAEERFFLSDKIKDTSDYEYIKTIYIDEEDIKNKSLFMF